MKFSTLNFYQTEWKKRNYVTFLRFLDVIGFHSKFFEVFFPSKISAGFLEFQENFVFVFISQIH